MTNAFAELIEVRNHLDGDTDTAKLQISNTRDNGHGFKPISSLVIRKSNVPALIAALTDTTK